MKNSRYSLSLAISWISIAINLLIAFSKFIIGFLSNSISILSDAAHSLGDLFTTVIVILSLYLSRKPPDKGHPFGHGRIEDIGGLILSFILIIIGINFLRDSFLRFFSPQSIRVSFLFIGLILLTALIKLILGIFAEKISKKVSSAILKTDAFHHYSDCITSLAVGVGLLFVKKGYLYVDSFFGFLVSLIVIAWAIIMGREFIDNLIGRRAPAAIYEKIKSIASSVEFVEGVHGIEIHSYGQNKIVSLHIEIDPSLSLEEAHKVADKIEKKVFQENLGKCIVHVDLKEV